MIESLRDLLGKALQSAGLEATGDAWKVGDAWEAAVGPTVAAHAAPAGLVRGELMVAAPDAVWRQELALLAPEIKMKINRALGRDVVQRVRIIAGPAAPRSEPEVRSDGADGARPAGGPAAAPPNAESATGGRGSKGRNGDRDTRRRG